MEAALKHVGKIERVHLAREAGSGFRAQTKVEHGQKLELCISVALIGGLSI